MMEIEKIKVDNCLITVLFLTVFAETNTLLLFALQPNQVILTLTNPSDVLSHVTLLPCDPDTDTWSTAKVLHFFVTGRTSHRT